MKVYAVDGGPRRGWNTETLLKAFLEGAEEGGKEGGNPVETEYIHLYDYDYKGCFECYQCKRKGGDSYGRCGIRDEIGPVLDSLSKADGIAFGSPIYFAGITGQLRSFLERLLYPFTSFEKEGPRSFAPKKIRTAFLYTMNAPETTMFQKGYPGHLAPMHGCVERVFGYPPEVVYSCFTLQYKDYSLYGAGIWDEEKKREWHKEQFPKDCQKAKDLGRILVKAARKEEQRR